MLAEAFQVTQAGIEQVGGLGQGNILVIEGSEGVEQGSWVRKREDGFEQGEHLVAGKGTTDGDLLSNRRGICQAQAEVLEQAVTRETVAAVQDYKRAAQGKFGEQLGEEVA